ncbi:MAG: M28 family peptidase [Vicinamibacterales bacterium]
MRRIHLSVALLIIALSSGAVDARQGNHRAALDLIKDADLRTWLTYISSDELEGRATFSEGIGLAASYITQHLREWGVKPGGDHDSYLQAVKVLGVRSTSRSTLTVEVNGQSKVFKDGEGLEFPKNVGGKRTFTVDRVEFMGYGLDAPAANHLDYAGKDVKGAAVVWLGPAGPSGVDAATYRRLITGRNRYATDQLGALAALGPAVGGFGGGGGGGGAAPTPAPAAGGGGGFGGAAIPRSDFTTVQRLDTPQPPAVTAKDELFDFLFSAAPEKYAALKEKASKKEALPHFTIGGVKLTFALDTDYEIVQTQVAHNVVGIIPGSDPRLRDTYVAFGAHFDHVGYAQGELTKGADGTLRRAGSVGRVTPSATDDRIWNGADDDGSGTVALMSLAKAFSQGSKPKRSVIIVWHVGEERGLWGSRYFADYPTVPIDKIVAQLNIDMIGRNRDDKAEEANSVYLVGSDRISTELHRLNIDANASLPKPLKLDYEMNDPADLEQVYYRSDHYSYAAKGIPITFYTTGLHPDYHANTDDVSKINFEKMTRIVQLVYETGRRTADLDHAPVRDNLGPRAGKATTSTAQR